MRSLALLCLGFAVAAAQGRAERNTTALGDCLEAAKIPFYESDAGDWEVYASPFNERLEYTPAAIAVPTTTEHIQLAVSCGAENGVKVTPKAGGHSYASLGLGGEAGHLVIQLDHMYNVTLDTETNIATVEPGARLGHLASELFAQGKRAISHGTCPGVGVSGHVLHGGFGMASNTHGLALDWVIGMTVVLANATVVECSERQHADLFWAMLGAGSNFGIAASYQFKTFEAPANVTWFSAQLPWNQSTAQAGLEALESYAKNTMPAELNMRLAGSSRSASVEGVHYGDKEGLEATLEPLLNKTGGSISEAKTGGWMDGIEHYANAEVDVSYPYEMHETFYSKSLTLKGLNGTSASSFVDYWYGTARDVTRIWWFQIDIQGGKNSAVSKADPTITSYAHRDKLFLIQLYDRSFGTYPELGFEFLDGWVSNTTADMEPSDWGMYINYADARMDRATAQKAYWGVNLPRLQEIKTKVDPMELFYYPISIEPALEPTQPAKSSAPETPAEPVKVKVRAKTIAELDEELKLKLEEISGEGGAAGLEYENGKAVAMKRGVKDNMFRLI
ncbi:hypothetical protein VE02_08841 [Pseudogymnoascus sp. 03VT05]|nr:hypothetical protein VE02_08841 [Pseudogymnoascus sp. 03VT05]